MKSPVIRWSLFILFAGALSVAAQEESEAPVPPRGGQGRIKIITTPSQAQAYMGGVNLGYTPVDTQFPSGRHTLNLVLNGENLVQERVNVWPDSTTTLERNLVMPYGSITLKIASLKCDCEVFVDGEDVGSTHEAPLTINHLRAGTRVIKVTNGGKFAEYNVVVPPEGTVELLVNFKAEE